jgi:hypothetical protein
MQCDHVWEICLFQVFLSVLLTKKTFINKVCLSPLPSFKLILLLEKFYIAYERIKKDQECTDLGILQRQS